tara:strand:- start:114 stop:272 length:159 start_codon:yes stop_codon:yes gene_type:complete
MVIAGKILDFSDAVGMGLNHETLSPFTVFSLGCISIAVDTLSTHGKNKPIQS